LDPYHLRLEGFTLFGSSNKIAGFEKPLSLFLFYNTRNEF